MRQVCAAQAQLLGTLPTLPRRRRKKLLLFEREITLILLLMGFAEQEVTLCERVQSQRRLAVDQLVFVCDQYLRPSFAIFNLRRWWNAGNCSVLVGDKSRWELSGITMGLID